MPDPVKQHTVPRGYLAEWAAGIPSEPKSVWRLEVHTGRQKPKHPKSILREPHIYTVVGKGGLPDYRFETFFKEREDAFYALRPKLLAMGELTTEEWVSLLVFTAAARLRTQMIRDRMREQWGHALRIAADMEAAMANMPPEKRKALPRRMASGIGPSLTLAQARKLHDEPIQAILGSGIKKLVGVFQSLSTSIIFAQGERNFITSDNPCVFFDPQAQVRLPPMRSFPEIDSSTLEVTMPLTPRACLALRADESGYAACDDVLVGRINQRTAYACNGVLIACNQNDWPEDLTRPPPWIGID